MHTRQPGAFGTARSSRTRIPALPQPVQDAALRLRSSGRPLLPTDGDWGFCPALGPHGVCAVDPLQTGCCRFQGGIRMSFKPVIGINGEFRAAKKEVLPLSWFNTGYYDSVTAAGGLPAPLAPSGRRSRPQAIPQDARRPGPLRLPARHGSRAARPQASPGHPHDAPATRRFRSPPLQAGLRDADSHAGDWHRHARNERHLRRQLHQHIPEEFQKPLHHRDPVESTLRHIIEIVPGTRMDRSTAPAKFASTASTTCASTRWPSSSASAQRHRTA